MKYCYLVHDYLIKINKPGSLLLINLVNCTFPFHYLCKGYHIIVWDKLKYSNFLTIFE